LLNFPYSSNVYKSLFSNILRTNIKGVYDEFKAQSNKTEENELEKVLLDKDKDEYKKLVDKNNII
jgi:hypothetical protein